MNSFRHEILDAEASHCQRCDLNEAMAQIAEFRSLSWVCNDLVSYDLLSKQMTLDQAFF